MGKMLALSMLAPFLLILPALAILEINFAYGLIFDGETIDGKVVSYDAQTQQTGTATTRRTYTGFFPVIEFTVQGKIFRATAETGSNHKTFDLGATVPIRYLKSNPNRIVIQSLLYSFVRPSTLIICSLFLCFAAFKIYSGQEIPLPLDKMKSSLFIPGAGIALLFGLSILGIGLNMGVNRIKHFTTGTIHSGIILESNIDTFKEETNILGKTIKSSHKGSRILAEYINPTTGEAVQEEVIGEASSKNNPGSPLQFLKTPNEKSIGLELPWFYISPLVIFAFGWAFCVIGFAFIKANL